MSLACRRKWEYPEKPQMHNVNLQNLHRENFCGGQSFEAANDHIFEREDRYVKGVKEAIYVYCE